MSNLHRPSHRDTTRQTRAINVRGAWRPQRRTPAPQGDPTPFLEGPDSKPVPLKNTAAGPETPLPLPGPREEPPTPTRGSEPSLLPPSLRAQSGRGQAAWPVSCGSSLSFGASFPGTRLGLSNLGALHSRSFPGAAPAPPLSPLCPGSGPPKTTRATLIMIRRPRMRPGRGGEKPTDAQLSPCKASGAKALLLTLRWQTESQRVPLDRGPRARQDLASKPPDWLVFPLRPPNHRKRAVTSLLSTSTPSALAWI